MNPSTRPSVACAEETNARWRMRSGFHPPAGGRPEACVFVTQSCSTTKKNNVLTPDHTTRPASKNMLVKSVTITMDKDTVQGYEAVFFDMESSLQNCKVMYYNHGKWTSQLSHIRQDNIIPLVWEDVT